MEKEAKGRRKGGKLLCEVRSGQQTKKGRIWGRARFLHNDKEGASMLPKETRPLALGEVPSTGGRGREKSRRRKGESLKHEEIMGTRRGPD